MQIVPRESCFQVPGELTYPYRHSLTTGEKDPSPHFPVGTYWVHGEVADQCRYDFGCDATMVASVGLWVWV